MIASEKGRCEAMKFRIGVWAFVGFLVAAGWAFYASATFPDLLQTKPVVWNLALLTQPIALASFQFHFPVSLYWVLVVNAATYALLGLLAEVLRRQLHHAR